MLVIDASALTELLLGRRAADKIAGHLAAHDYQMHAPHLLDIEVASALRRVVTLKVASADRASGALEDLLDLPIERHRHDVLLPRVWQLRKNFSAHDAAYVALAEALSDEGVPLLTADARLARAAHKHADVRALLV
jgi:predicted nucleic acid-binding protein